MKKLILTLALMAGCSPSWAISLDELKNQIIDQTKVTILSKGGVASFYDMTTGQSNALRAGVIDHVLTNRFINADLGWSGGFDGHVDGILVGGASVRLDEAFTYYFPNASDSTKAMIPSVLQKFYVGLNTGWAVDNGAFHWGFHLGYDF